jgi:WD40 repeat protein/mono/diheme cytochrome c family protein
MAEAGVMQIRFLVCVILLGLAVAQAAMAREWSDTSGKFRVTAEFVAVRSGKVFLEKPDGSVISVPVERLSEADQKFLQSLNAKPATDPAPATGGTDDAAPADPQALTEKVRAIFEANCYRCHGNDGANEGGFNFVLNLEKLAMTHVKPKDVVGSTLYERLSTRDGDTVMPPAGEMPRPSAQDIATVRRWIEAGAPAPKVTKPRDFISNDYVMKQILTDLQATPERARRYNRYFTLTHLYNSGISDDELLTYRHAFNKLINSLSWNAEVVLPQAIDPAATVLRIDMRSLNWNDAIWEEIVQRNPYGLLFASEDAKSCYELTHTHMPLVRVDWFVFAASRPPLYHSILALPSTDQELEQMLHVNVAADIQQEQTVRAAFNRSGVSRNNRLIERHRQSNGAYWKSYDFADSTGQKNLFEHPMGPGTSATSFKQDGGEIIFSLPNGMQGYMLVDGRGRRIDKGPTEIVSDSKRSDRAVMNGISCMSCHYAGMITKSHEIRPFVNANKKAFDDPESILALYAEQKVLDDSFEADGKRFAAAMEKIGIKTISRTGEPVSTMALRFEQELDAKLAAAEFGMTPADFDAALVKADSVIRSLGSLRTPGGTVKRDQFVQVFAKAAAEFGLTPVVPTAPLVAALKRSAAAVERSLEASGESQLPPTQKSTANQKAPAGNQRVAGMQNAPATQNAAPQNGAAMQTPNPALGPYPYGYPYPGFVPNPALVPPQMNMPGASPNVPGSLSRRPARPGNGSSADETSDAASAATSRSRSSTKTEVPKSEYEFRNYGEMGWGVHSLAFSPNGKWLVAGRQDRAILIFDVKTGAKLDVKEDLDALNQVPSLAFTPDGKKLLAGGYSGEIHIWNVSPTGNLSPAGKFTGHSGEVESICVSRDGKFALSGSKEKKARYWQIDTGRETSAISEFKGAVKACAMLPDGKRGVATDGTKLVEFELATGNVERSFVMGKSSYSAAAISPSGDRVMAADGHTLRVWDAQTGQELTKLESQDSPKSGVFSADSKLLFTGTKSINFWEVGPARRYSTIEVSGYATVESMAISADGNFVAAIGDSAGQELKVYRVPKP